MISVRIANRFGTAIVVEAEDSKVVGTVPSNTTVELSQGIVRQAGGFYVLLIPNTQGKLLVEIRKDCESINAKLQNHTWNLVVP